MCGRFTQRMTWRELHERMDLIGTPLNLRPRYNVAPGQDVAVVRAADPGSGSGAGPGRGLAMLRWGLIPAWAKDPAIAWKLINARSETAAEKPSFRSAFRQRRCLIPADGFYEWQRRDGNKQTWLFGLPDDAPFAFAGLWEQWRIPEGAALTGSLAERNPGDTVETCTILTTAANDTVAPVHGRMPVILPPDAWGPWLAGEDVPLAPYPADAMTAHPVSTLVNRAANEDPRCVEPITLT
ncbi:MAG: SOS response-associated peptidase [Rhodospirillales bacterium]|nr:SOS response-associated peptidase [Rhodospirillales bacterium]